MDSNHHHAVVDGSISGFQNQLVVSWLASFVVFGLRVFHRSIYTLRALLGSGSRRRQLITTNDLQPLDLAEKEDNIAMRPTYVATLEPQSAAKCSAQTNRIQATTKVAWFTNPKIINGLILRQRSRQRPKIRRRRQSPQSSWRQRTEPQPQ